MSRSTRKTRIAAIAALAALVLVGAACSSDSNTSSGSSGSASSGASAASLLGPANAATGTPIKIGFINDGKTQTVDHTNLSAGFKATVKYANEHLGGINGHVIDVQECTTDSTPSGATQCAVNMAGSGVAAVLVPVSNEDGAIFKALAGSGIPYLTYSSADQSILLQPGSFILTNPIAAIAAPGLIAKDSGAKKVGFIIIDVPAATGPISAIAKPVFANIGVELEIIAISPQVADMTPQLQQAISGGSELFAITGTTEFVTSALLGLDQLGFKGQVLSSNISPEVIANVGPVIEGVLGTGSTTDDPADPDVQLFNAVLDTYAPGTKVDIGTQWAFSTVVAFVHALTGVTTAVDAASVNAALGAMPKPVDLPLGGGITFQCGSKPVSFAPGICSSDVLKFNRDAQGQGYDYQVLKVPPGTLSLG